MSVAYELLAQMRRAALAGPRQPLGWTHRQREAALWALDGVAEAMRRSHGTGSGPQPAEQASLAELLDLRKLIAQRQMVPALADRVRWLMSMSLLSLRNVVCESEEAQAVLEAELNVRAIANAELHLPALQELVRVLGPHPHLAGDFARGLPPEAGERLPPGVVEKPIDNSDLLDARPRHDA